jgi:hypothetical protein
MPSYSNEQLEELGKRFRQILEIDDQLTPDPIDFLRRLKHAGYIKDYVELPDTAFSEAEAKYVPEDEKIYLRKSTYLEARKRTPHFCFTVFHEGAHALLGHKQERRRSLGDQGRLERRIVPEIRRDETEANRLTAAIMAPYHKANFTLDTTPAEIARRFNLSAPAAKARHDEFARMYRRDNNIRRPLPRGVSDFLVEQRRRGYLVTALPSDETAAMQLQQPLYTGDPCPNSSCGEFRMIRNGTASRCEVCGAQTGDD